MTRVSWRDTERRWEEALERFDREAMQSLLAEDDLQTDFRGAVQDKASWIEAFKQAASNVRSGESTTLSTAAPGSRSAVHTATRFSAASCTSDQQHSVIGCRQSARPASSSTKLRGQRHLCEQQRAESEASRKLFCRA